jgi:sporulation-control protein spo0M
MGFFQNIKNKLGIGGVKVELQVPGQVAKNAGQLQGKVVLTSKSDQELLHLKISIKEEYTTGRGDDKKTKTFTLGEVTKQLGYGIKAGETKEIPFDLKFELLKSNSDELKDMGGAMGKLGSLSAFANNEKSTYYVEAEADVKSAALDPSDKKDIKLV